MPFQLARDLVGQEPAAAELADAVVIELRQQLAEMALGRAALAAEVDHDQAADHRARHLAQAEAARVEVLDLVHVGSGAEVALEVV